MSSSQREMNLLHRENVSSSQRKTCLLHRETVSSSHRSCVFSGQKLYLFDTDNMLCSNRTYVLFKQKNSYFRQRGCLVKGDGGGRCPVRFRAGAGMKIGNDGERVGVKMGEVGGRGERFWKNGKMGN